MNPLMPKKAYLLRQKKDRYLVISARLLVFLIFLAQWEILSRLHWIDSFIFSSPSMLLETFVKMAKDQSLFIHIGATLKETLLSFFFVILLGLGISILLWGCPRLAKVLEPYLVVLNSLPKSALAPLLIVWLGARQRTIIVAGMSVAIFGSILNLYTGFKEIPPEKLKLIRTLGGGKKDELLKNCPACFHSHDSGKHEGKHRALPCRCHHRGVHRCKTRAWISNHIWQSDIPVCTRSDIFPFFLNPESLFAKSSVTACGFCIFT